MRLERRCRDGRRTSAPSPGAFRAAYEAAASDGCTGVIVLTLSADLSGTYQSAVVAREAVAGLIDVRVIDTQAVSMAQGLLTIEIAEMAQEGATLDDLEQHALDCRSRVGVLAMLDTLDQRGLFDGHTFSSTEKLAGRLLSARTQSIALVSYPIFRLRRLRKIPP